MTFDDTNDAAKRAYDNKPFGSGTNAPDLTPPTGTPIADPQKAQPRPKNSPTKKELALELQKIQELQIAFEDHVINVIEDGNALVPRRTHNSMESIHLILAESFTTKFAALAKLDDYDIPIDLLPPDSDGVFYGDDASEDDQTQACYDRYCRHKVPHGRVTFYIYDLQLKHGIDDPDELSSDDLEAMFNPKK